MKKIEIGSVSILDMVSLPDYGIVIADYNKRLIVLDVNNLSVKTGEILLEGKPYGIAIISDHVVGISIGHTQIMTLDMRTKVPTQNTHAVADAGTQLWGLTYIEGDFFIAARDKIVRTKETVSQYYDVLCIPNGCIFYLQIHDRKLFFTDYKDKSFQCTTLTGEKLFKYQNTLLDGPYGFTRLTDASFYISDWLSDKVLKITCKTDE